jgi:O-antigen ligase
LQGHHHNDRAPTRLLTDDRAVALFAGFFVPWISFLGDRWIDYSFPAAAAAMLVALARAGVTWGDYWRVLPKGLLAAIAGLVVLTLIGALRVIDKVDLLDKVRMLLLPGVIYLCLYLTVGLFMLRHTGLHERVLKWTLAGIGVGLVFMAAQNLSGGLYGRYVLAPLISEEYHTSYLNRAEMMLAISAWITAPFAARRYGRVAGCALPALVWLIGLFGQSEMILVGLPLSVLIYLVALRAPAATRDAVFAAALIALFVAPLAYPVIFRFAPDLPLLNSEIFLVRAEIWNAVSHFSLDSPIFGHGLHATRLAGPVPIQNLYYPPAPIWHPHNGFLQIWGDLGLVGVVCAAGVIGAGWRLAARVREEIAPTVVASFSLLTLAFVSTHAIWSTWWLGFIACNACGLIALAGPADLYAVVGRIVPRDGDGRRF